MKKAVIILSIFSVITNSCGQATKKQRTETMKIPEILNECWTEEGSSENSGENKIEWYEDGFFSFTEINLEKTYSPFGDGIYVYKPETREIFAQIINFNARQVISDTTKYDTSLKKHFLILEMTDNTVVVNTVPSNFEINWFEFHFYKGNWQFIFTNAVTDEIPFITKRYKRSKLESGKNEE